MFNNSKTILGKLMASENIRVEHKNVRTASFDVKKRVLTLPNWTDLTSDLYDLFIGHEVGHALFTPSKGWMDVLKKHGTDLKDFLNIVEDARIEKLMKKKYPGLRKPMYSGYSLLVDRGFFGISPEEYDSLPFVDRLNLHFKLGSLSNIHFSETEQEIINQVSAIESWEEVVKYAIILQKLTEDEKEMYRSLFDQLSFSGELGDDISEDTQKIIDDLIEKLESDGNQELAEKLRNMSEEMQQNFIDWAGADENFEEINSITEKVFSEKKDAFVSDEREKDYLLYPEVNSNHWIVSSEIFQNDVENFIESSMTVEKKNQLYDTFISENKNYVSYMVKEFELKKSASLFAKAKTSKTGKLNSDKLWSYKTNENIFLNTTVIPEGKNHGMIMLVDMSASMDNIIEGTIKQVLSLAMFCRKVNIPFEVYGFFSNYSNPGENWREESAKSEDGRENAIQIGYTAFSLKQFVHSGMNSVTFRNSVSNLVALAYSYKRTSWYAMPNSLSLGGTPLNESIIALTDVAKKFRKKNNIEILNTIILTDGDSSTPIYFGKGRRHQRTYNAVVQDVETGSSVKVSGRGTEALLEIYKKKANSNVIGYYLMNNPNRNAIHSRARNVDENFSFMEFNKKYENEYKTNKYYEVNPSYGYDKYYIVSGNDLNKVSDDLEDVLKGYKNKDSKGSLLRAFRKVQNKKNFSRVFLNKFVEEIA